MVVEGIDASGKTTQALRLRERLEREGRTVYTRLHPAEDNWAGVRARRFLLAEGRNAHFASAMFYIADVLRSVVLTPWRAYDYVIYVRYLMGTVYLPPPIGRFAYHFFAAFLPKPRETIFLMVDPEEAHKRILQGRKRREMFESKEQLKKIGSRALVMARSNHWIIINATEMEEVVGEMVWAELRRDEG